MEPFIYNCANASSVNMIKNYNYLKKAGYTYTKHFGLSKSQWLPCIYICMYIYNKSKNIYKHHAIKLHVIQVKKKKYIVFYEGCKKTTRGLD